MNQNKNPIVSIIIPALNEEKYIKNILDDILNNIYENWEVIVVDNGSSDNTILKAKECAKNNKKINVISINRKGPPIARNYGAAGAKGEYLLFFDADVRINKTFIRDAISELEMRNLDVGGIYIAPDSARISDKVMWFIVNNFILKVFQYFFPVNPGCGGILTKKAIHEKIKGFNEGIVIYDDHDYVRRSGRAGKFRMLKKVKAVASMRRFDKEGRFTVWLKWLIAVPFYILGRKRAPFRYFTHDDKK
jgi:glycosyltransferase involved in cell wall biosynthesis